MSNIFDLIITGISGGGAIVLVIGFAKYLGDIFSKHVGQNHEKLVNKNEHFHQISQESYQKLFDRKIEIYDNLSVLSLKFNSYTLTSKEAINNSYIEEHVKEQLFEVHYKCIYDKYIMIVETIERNSSVISKELLSNYIQWKNHLRSNTDPIYLSLQELYASKINLAYSCTDDLESSLQSDQFLEQLDKTAAILHNLHVFAIGEIVESNLNYFQKLLDCIIEDSSKINSKINELN